MWWTKHTDLQALLAMHGDGGMRSRGTGTQGGAAWGRREGRESGGVTTVKKMEYIEVRETP
jgi:hypothetical protein